MASSTSSGISGSKSWSAEEADRDDRFAMVSLLYGYKRQRPMNRGREIRGHFAQPSPTGFRLAPRSRTHTLAKMMSSLPA